MTEIRHVLVPTDGSEGACKAAVFAGNLARAVGAKVSVLMVQSEELIMPHAWGPAGSPAGVPYGSMSIEEVRNMLEQRVRDKEMPATLDALGELAEAPELLTVWGHPMEEICRYASEQGVDLIIIGSHGRSGLARVLLGSVSSAVASHAPCPVTIVR